MERSVVVLLGDHCSSYFREKKLITDSVFYFSQEKEFGVL